MNIISNLPWRKSPNNKLICNCYREQLKFGSDKTIIILVNLPTNQRRDLKRIVFYTTILESAWSANSTTKVESV